MDTGGQLVTGDGVTRCLGASVPGRWTTGSPWTMEHRVWTRRHCIDWCRWLASNRRGLFASQINSAMDTGLL